MSDLTELTTDVPARRRGRVWGTLSGWVRGSWIDLTSPRGYRGIAVIIAAYVGIYSIIEARHEREMNLATFERNMFITMVTAESQASFVTAMKDFGPVQTVFVLKDPSLFEFWHWWEEIQPNVEPLYDWAIHRIPLCKSEECGGLGEQKIDLSYANLNQSILMEVDLSFASLYEAQLREADMRGSYMASAILERADLRGAELASSNLRNANLQRADLEGANLEGANLRDANLRRTDLQNANLEKANLRNANLERAELRSTNLEKAKLRRANLERARLWYANLKEAELWYANLTGATLQGANLEKAQLWDATLTKARLLRANLENADLRGATGLTCEQLERAHYWRSACRDVELACNANIPAPKTCE